MRRARERKNERAVFSPLSERGPAPPPRLTRSVSAEVDGALCERKAKGAGHKGSGGSGFSSGPEATANCQVGGGGGDAAALVWLPLFWLKGMPGRKQGGISVLLVGRVKWKRPCSKGLAI